MTVDYGDKLAERLKEAARSEGYTFAELMRSLGRAHLERQSEVLGVRAEDPVAAGDRGERQMDGAQKG